MRLIENLSVTSFENYLSNETAWDFFISCGSFEERCKRSSAILSDKKVPIGSSIIFNYKESDPEQKKEENIRQMKQNLTQISRYSYIFNTESVSKPSEGLKSFRTFLAENHIDLSEKKILIDITVFTKPYFFLLFKLLNDKYKIHQFYVTYTEPDKYKDKSEGQHELILTEGLDRVESIPGFVGSSIQSKDALVVLMGFEGKRALETFYAVNPEVTYAILGFPAFKSGWHNISLEANLRFLKEVKVKGNLFLASAIDPYETQKTILQIVNKIRQDNQDCNIVIAPLGTKPQAFGVLLSAFQDNTIKVIYPFPSVYKTDSSYKYGPTWILKTDLDKSIEVDYES